VAVSYNKLWKILIDKKMKRVELMEATGIGTSTLSKLGKDQYVSMEVLVKICRVLNCNIGDIVDYLKDKEGSY
jgi:DNA-binding Xre family transcriptional regulator